MSEQEYLTADQAAEKLQLHPKTIRRMLSSGQIPGMRVGARQWRISAAILKDYVEGKLESPPAPKKPTTKKATKAAKQKPAPREA